MKNYKITDKATKTIIGVVAMTPDQARPVFHRRSMSEDQDTQTGAAVYQVFVQYAGDLQKISAKDQHAPGQAPEQIAQDQPTGGDQKTGIEIVKS